MCESVISHVERKYGFSVYHFFYFVCVRLCGKRVYLCKKTIFLFHFFHFHATVRYGAVRHCVPPSITQCFGIRPKNEAVECYSLIFRPISDKAMWTSSLFHIALCEKKAWKWKKWNKKIYFYTGRLFFHII